MQPLLVFDLDGTLAETAGDLIAALNAVTVPEGLVPIPIADARSVVGAGARALIQRAYASQDVALDPATLERLFRAFLVYYEAHIADQSTLYPGVIAALDRLEARGFAFAICTNKFERAARLLLDALGIGVRFKAICGQDTFAIAKPDPRILIQTITQAGGAVEDAVMIGDSGADISVAKAAHVPVVAVDFGYADRPIADFAPDRIISHFDDLDAAIDAVRKRQRASAALTADGRLS